MTPSKLCIFGNGTNKEKNFLWEHGVLCFLILWFWAIVGIRVDWVLEYILVTVYSLLFSGVHPVVLFDLSLSCVPSCVISLFHNYIFGKPEYHTAAKGGWQSWRGRQYQWLPGPSPDHYTRISKHALTPRGPCSLYGVCWVERDVPVYTVRRFWQLM